jgi:Zn-dependent alcohol dehydrogenase
VVTLFSPQCRECEHCHSPRTNLCLAIREQQGLGFLPDGTAEVTSAASDMGPGTWTSMTQVAAETLGMRGITGRVSEHRRQFYPKGAR